MTLFHTTTSENITSIFEDGLKPAHYDIYDTLNPFTIDGTICLPETENPHDFAIKIALTVLEENRPAKYPAHHTCLFFFPTIDMTGDLNRPHILEISDDAFATHELYTADYQIANELFFETMRRMEFLNEIPHKTLDTLSTKYWNSCTKHTTPETIEGYVEVFTQKSPINPQYITQIE